MGARGKLIVLEGIDGSGKTTQAGHLADWLASRGHSAQVLREPGGTPLGEELRAMLKAGKAGAPLAELLLFCAARAELVSAMIAPALDSGSWVVLDRFVHSTLAYQGALGAVPFEDIEAVASLSSGGIAADITLWLAIAPPVALARLGGARRDAFEQRGAEYLEAVHDIYARLALLGAMETIDASEGEAAVRERIRLVVAACLPGA
jgi:dTMP kinase